MGPAQGQLAGLRPGHPRVVTGSSFSGPVDGPGIAGNYLERHNPATVFTDVAAGACNGHNRCNGSRLPNADSFLRAFMPGVSASRDFANTILFITFDEGGTLAGLQGDTGGHVYTAVVAPWLSHVTSNTLI